MDNQLLAYRRDYKSLDWGLTLGRFYLYWQEGYWAEKLCIDSCVYTKVRCLVKYWINDKWTLRGALRPFSLHESVGARPFIIRMGWKREQLEWDIDRLGQPAMPQYMV